MSALSTEPTAAIANSGLHWLASCTAACGYEQRAVDLTGRYCPYCAQDVEYQLERRDELCLD
jgi:hypothetical protein